jgi:alkylation response protein AidB-like acyl-CoA dehydrogenase
MDFTFTEEQEAVAEAAASVFDGMVTPARVAEIERTDDRVDDDLWAALARSNLLGLAVPEAYGGSGLGLTEICLVLEQQGRAVAPVPLWATAVLGAMPLAAFGTPDQKERFLPGVVSGEIRLSAALTEAAASASGRPAVTAVADGTGWTLHGTARVVPQAHLAARVLVPALSDQGVVVVLVDPAGPGCSLERVATTDRQIHPHLHMEGVGVDATDVVAAPADGAAVVTWMLERARVGLCAIQLGVTEEAIRRAAAYLNERHQFGRPLSSFQGTMLRAADAYIDSEAIRVTLWMAAWQIDTGRQAADAVATAKWWASEAGQRVVHATQHLHGGMGADIEYPIHRYFLWGKQIELMLEAPSAQLARMGTALAARYGRPATVTSTGASTGASGGSR